MFTKSSCYMNLMQYHEDSLKESLKMTMLNQENLFRKQVQELHRLYQIQMILMKNFRLKEVPATQSLNYFKRDCTLDWARYDQKPLDLEVPVCSYVNSFDRHVLNKGNNWGTRENPVEVEDYFHAETESSLEEAKLSLGIGRETSQRMSRWISQNEVVHVLQDTGEVEESIETVFIRDVELKPALCCGACSANTRERNGSWACCNFTNSTDIYSCDRARKFQSRKDESINVLEDFNLGNNKWLENLPETKSAVGEVFPSRGAICLDLNTYPDESFSESKHPTESPDAGSWTKPNDNCSMHVSALLLEHDTPSSVLIYCKKTDRMNPSGSKVVCSIDLESYPLSPSNSSEGHDFQCKMEKPVEDDVPSRNFKDENVMEVIVEKSDDVLLHSCSGVEDVAIDERSLDSSKSDCIASDPSSSLKTMQSGTYLEKSFSRKNSFQNSDSSQVDSFAIGESKGARSSDEDNGGSAEDDPVIQKGAVSLTYFLLEARREHDSIGKTVERRRTEVVRVKMDQPEYSMDSFESTVLKQPECNIDYCCVSSSNPFEINDMDKKDCGIKLRRGRRLKDFQKEILPSLPSLSRQEICEDIRIMEGAIRSREYKRNRSKVSCEQNWFTPVRSRRSRLNYIGRRCYK